MKDKTFKAAQLIAAFLAYSFLVLLVVSFLNQWIWNLGIYLIYILIGIPLVTTFYRVRSIFASGRAK
jgi:hypothetical protein